MNRCLLFLSSVLLVLLSVNSIQAQSKSAAKIPQNLIALYNQYLQHLASGSTPIFQSDDRLVTLVGNSVVIDAAASGDVETLKDDLVSLGMQGAVAFGRMVSGRLPISSILAAAELASLRYALTATAVTNAGIVTSQGDESMGAHLARSIFGVNGNGIKVGVLSDSYNCFGGAGTDISNGDLSPVAVLQEISGCAGATDEGRAMLQIVHDVAPGSALSFASAFNGMASFAANITALKNSGAKVIVDDVIYLAETMFQDGIIAQAVDGVVSNGVAYFSSAGNNSRNAYSSGFRASTVFAEGAFPSVPGAPFFGGGTAHNFDTGAGIDVFQRVTLPNNGKILMSFQWDSPAFSVSGSPGSHNDVDIYIFDAAQGQVVGGATFNNLGADPVEFVSFTNTTGATADFNIMITNFSGANPGTIKYVLFNFNGVIQEFASNSGTIYGHANAAWAEAVGAARYSNTPMFGVSPPIPESFSSAGTTPILFDLSGNRLATPDLRAYKPELIAPDGADTTFFGFSDPEANGHPNFFGTSAAAPHAAAVAALLLEARPTLSPAKIYSSLEKTAIDMDTAGFDNNTGFGLIRADTALAKALQPTSVDFDGDGISDFGIYRDGIWWIMQSSNGAVVGVGFGGLAQDIPVPSDYDGDGKTDQAVYRDGIWWIMQSSNGAVVGVGLGGMVNDVPLK